jgi:hypothetical protein
MLALCCSPAWWEHKARLARLTRNLIGGTAKMTANHLDFFLKNNISTALRTIDFDLHLGLHTNGATLIMEEWNLGIMEYWVALANEPVSPLP